MARGDGKAQRGYTRGRGVIKMAAGGNLAARDAAMGGAAVGSRAEATRSTGLGGSTRDGGFGGAGSSAGGAGGGDRIGAGSQPSRTTTRTESMSIIDNPKAMSARLGPNAAQAMVGAGVDPDSANVMAKSLNRRTSDPFYSGDRGAASPSRTGSFDGQTQRVEATLAPKQFPTRPISYSKMEGTPIETGWDPVTGTFRTPAKQFPTRPISYTGVPKMEGTPIETGWDPVSGTFKDPKLASAPPAKSPMAVYGNEFSFTPKELTGALKSMYWAGLPGASAKELRALQEKMKDPQNQAIARTIAAPFSDKTRAPVKSITERVTSDPSYSTKDQESVLGTNTPAIAKGDAVNTTTISKTPATRAVTAAPPAVPLPRPRPEPAPVAATPPKPAATKKATRKDGSVFVKDGVRYQVRDGKAYNFNVPGDKKERSFGGGRRSEGGRQKANGGVVRRTDGVASRGKTRGRYI